MKKIIFVVVGALLMFFIGNNAGYVYRSLSDTKTPIEKINNTVDLLPAQLKKMSLSKEESDLKTGIYSVFAVLLIMLLAALTKEKKTFRKGEEHGSARWGTAADIKPYIDKKDFSNNIILSQTERLTMASRLPPNKIKYARNKNVLIVGGSGSGKTRFYLKPQLMQMHSNYVVTDPKGLVFYECAKMLEDNGYKIKVLNLINMTKSMHYNPFAYIKDEKDILKLVNCFMNNTNGTSKQNEDFWIKAERLWLTAHIAYVFYEAPDDEKNFNTVSAMLNMSEVVDDPDYKSAIDMMFDELPDNHFAKQEYQKYKKAAGETAKSILISVGVRLAVFDINIIKDLVSYDEMELDIVDRKTALFILVPDTDKTYNFIAAMLYTQLFDTLCFIADDKYNGRLPIHYRCLLDEFANIGMIPDFEILIATIRSREISVSPILQTVSQLKSIYKDNADTIIGNCDSFIFLGGKEKQTLKDVSEMLGKATIDALSVNENRGRDRSSSLNYSILGRELMTMDELAVMDGGECIVTIRGARPFKSKKFDITAHKNYKLLADYDEKNRYVFHRDESSKLEVKPDDVFKAYQVAEPIEA
jgi:type IV secretion system protein VirD4